MIKRLSERTRCDSHTNVMFQATYKCMLSIIDSIFLQQQQQQTKTEIKIPKLTEFSDAHYPKKDIYETNVNRYLLLM